MIDTGGGKPLEPEPTNVEGGGKDEGFVNFETIARRSGQIIRTRSAKES